MTPPDDTDYDDASGYQGSAYLKQQNSAVNQETVAAKPASLRDVARNLATAGEKFSSDQQDSELASTSSAAKSASEQPFTQAVKHLNDQTERSLGYPSSQGGSSQ